MKWLKRVALVLVVLLLVLGVVGVTLPTTFTVSRSVVIDAPRDVVHALVSDLERWPQWEPWTQADPTVSTTLGDQTTGVGANQSWSDQSGGGVLTFTQVDPETGVVYDMTFGQTTHTDPPTGEGRIVYAAAADAPGSIEVTWAMDADMALPVVGGYLAKLMPSAITPMFDDGLQRLKQAAEGEDAEGSEPEVPGAVEPEAEPAA